jgi:hypothetical protein
MIAKYHLLLLFVEAKISKLLMLLLATPLLSVASDLTLYSLNGNNNRVAY